jgi:hypothetical protein
VSLDLGLVGPTRQTRPFLRPRDPGELNSRRASRIRLLPPPVRPRAAINREPSHVPRTLDPNPSHYTPSEQRIVSSDGAGRAHRRRPLDVAVGGLSVGCAATLRLWGHDRGLGGSREAS